MFLNEGLFGRLFGDVQSETEQRLSLEGITLEEILDANDIVEQVGYSNEGLLEL